MVSERLRFPPSSDTVAASEDEEMADDGTASSVAAETDEMAGEEAAGAQAAEMAGEEEAGAQAAEMAGEEAAGAQAAEDDERAGAKRMAILLEKVMDRIASLDQKVDRIEKKCDASRRDGADSNKKHKSSGNKPSKEARRAVPFEWSRFTASDDDTDDAQRLNEKEAHELLQPYIEVRLAARFPIPCPLAIVLTYHVAAVDGQPRLRVVHGKPWTQADANRPKGHHAHRVPRHRGALLFRSQPTLSRPLLRHGSREPFARTSVLRMAPSSARRRSPSSPTAASLLRCARRPTTSFATLRTASSSPLSASGLWPRSRTRLRRAR